MEIMRELLAVFEGLIEILGGFTIVVGVVWAVFGYIMLLIENSESKAHHVKVEDLRLKLGRYLGLGLDFLIASDILKTIVDPSNKTLTLLGVIVIIRVLLTIFLSREIEHLIKLEKRN